MTSEDVIHSFFVPAFRIKKDAVARPLQHGVVRGHEDRQYHLFCAEYCGTEHSKMIGRVVVMEPDRTTRRWLAGAAGRRRSPPVAAGEKLFTELGCITCHRRGLRARAGPGAGFFGRPVVALATATPWWPTRPTSAESIVNPRRRWSPATSRSCRPTRGR
jgi:cytochrome c oxidase subunit II